MNYLPRRAFLHSFGLTGVALLAACAVTTTNGVTTITLDVTKVKNYGRAGLNAAATVTSFLATFPALAPYAVAIEAAEAALSVALSAFSNAAGSSLTISYNDANWKTRVDSILTALDGLASVIAKTIAGSGKLLPAAILADTKTADNALATVISVFKALLGVSDARAPVGTPAQFTRDMLVVGAVVPSTGMTEARALAILGVR